MSKATVVNTLPWELEENKPGNTPDKYIIPGAPKGDISTLVVHEAYFTMRIPLSSEKTPPMRVPITAEAVAQGLVQDYINSSVYISQYKNDDGAFPVPGLFWVEGGMNDVLVKAKHRDLVEQALKNTAAWFTNLIKIADDDWEKFRLHKMITDPQRRGAKWLGIEREWLAPVIVKTEEMQECFACHTLVSKKAILCYNCKSIVNKEAFEKNKEMFVNR